MGDREKLKVVKGKGEVRYAQNGRVVVVPWDTGYCQPREHDFQQPDSWLLEPESQLLYCRKCGTVIRMKVESGD